MRTLPLALVPASLLALTACGGGTEADNTSANTLGTETLPPIDDNADLGTGAGPDRNTAGNTSLEVGANVSANTGATDSGATTNIAGNSQ
ncbi:hypothetical protein [Sphingosinicella sp. YJ22]|uniref:hypothetical protein n=1 Tax=Sphingosinicella sp. YJ22 TaxID=1104780 RepID=UPI00140BC480|nr:hypothetical protein [Sphingosinicella sp. YJ22]